MKVPAAKGMMNSINTSKFFVKNIPTNVPNIAVVADIQLKRIAFFLDIPE